MQLITHLTHVERRWLVGGCRGADGAGPPTLGRVLFHLLQEYARPFGHLGQLDVSSWNSSTAVPANDP